MNNPLVDGWLTLWDRLIGRQYRYRPDLSFEQLSIPTRHFVYKAQLYAAFGSSAAIADFIAAGELKPTFHYRHFKKRKRNGDWRNLAEPDPSLKEIQRRIDTAYIKNAHLHPAAMGYRKGRSVADHAWAHAGAHVIITADIMDFFPSTTAGRVHEWWMSQLQDEQAASLATTFTTYRGSLPQGAPTSPGLSNAVNFALDQRLALLTERSGGKYTRYADDIVFSWARNSRCPADFYSRISSILREYGYQINQTKGWQVQRSQDEPIITGVVLRKHGVVTIPDEMRRKIRKLEASGADDQVLAGYRGYLQMIERRR